MVPPLAEVLPKQTDQVPEYAVMEGSLARVMAPDVISQPGTLWSSVEGYSVMEVVPW